MTYKAKSLDYDSTKASYWETQTLDPATVVTAVPAGNIGGTMFTAVFTRTVPASVIEDVAEYSTHYVVRPGVAGLSSELNTADMAFVETSFINSAWTTYKTFVSNSWTFKEISWRDFGADFPLDQNGNSRPGPIKRVFSVNQPGGGANIRMPDQVAATLTYRTPSRKHWGRCYLGGFTPPTGASDNFGRIRQATVDSVAAAFDTHFNTCGANARQIEPVVWSSRYRGLFSVDALVMDDVFDVIRRRRAKQASYRKIFD